MNLHLKTLSLLLPLTLLTACKNEITPEWEQYYSHASSNESRVEWLSNVAVDGYGEIISGGSTIRTGTDRQQNILLVKRSSDGELIWSTDIDLAKGNYRSDDKITDLTLDSDGNSYAIGVSYIVENDIQRYGSFLVKVDTYGELVWSIELSKHDDARDLELHQDQLYVTGFATQVFNLDGVKQLKIEHEKAWDIEINDAGDIHVVGAEKAAKYNAAGQLAWAVDLPADLYLQAALAVLSDDSIVIAHNQQDDSTRIAGISPNGQPSWSKTYYPPQQSYGLPGPALLKADWRDNVVLSLSNDKSRRLVKLNEQGQELWQTTSQNIVQDLALDEDSAVYVVGGGNNEKFDSSGQFIGATVATSGTQITTGSIALEGDNMYIGYSAVKDGEIQHYLAKFLNQ